MFYSCSGFSKWKHTVCQQQGLLKKGVTQDGNLHNGELKINPTMKEQRGAHRLLPGSCNWPGRQSTAPIFTKTVCPSRALAHFTDSFI